MQPVKSHSWYRWLAYSYNNYKHLLTGKFSLSRYTSFFFCKAAPANGCLSSMYCPNLEKDSISSIPYNEYSLTRALTEEDKNMSFFAMCWPDPLHYLNTLSLISRITPK